MSSSNSLLLSDVELKGKITEKDDIILGCKFDGNIVANKVNLSDTAIINGDINANEIEVNGKINGSLAAKKLRLMQDAILKVMLLEKAYQLKKVQI
jgi:cytoskeletal protein CcmA (bactofilin family)